MSVEQRGVFQQNVDEKKEEMSRKQIPPTSNDVEVGIKVNMSQRLRRRTYVPLCLRRS